MNGHRNDEEVYGRLQGILCDLLCLRPEEIRPESLLLDDLDLDSLGFIELAFTVEKTFGVDFPDVKANEETFMTLLPEALQRIEAMGGDTTLFEYVKQEVCRVLLGEPGAPAVLTPQTRDQLFRAQTASAIAHALGGRVPDGIDPETSITALRLNDLFRLLTVGTVGRYIEHLISTQAARGHARAVSAVPWS
jgi:acyl carrier protein